MMSVEKLVSGNYRLHKAGTMTVRENCIYAESVDDVPEFLLKDGAVEVLSGGSAIRLYAVEGPAERSFPVYVCYEAVSAANSHKVPGKFGSWPKDNGKDTLKLIDGKLYNLPVSYQAAMISEEVPEWVTSAGFPVRKNGDDYELVRTDWGGEVRRGRIGQAFWVRYGEGDVNILDIHEESAANYVLMDESGEDIGTLTEVGQQLGII